jgi:hypothetical protein
MGVVIDFINITVRVVLMKKLLRQTYNSQNNHVQTWRTLSVLLGGAAKDSLTVKNVYLLFLAFLCIII